MSKNKTKNREKKDKPAPLPAGQERLIDLVVHGDFRAARTAARRSLTDPATSEEGRAAALEVLRHIEVDGRALAVGVVGLLVQTTIAFLLLH
jgi:hypothetical protein